MIPVQDTTRRFRRRSRDTGDGARGRTLAVVVITVQLTSGRFGRRGRDTGRQGRCAGWGGCSRTAERAGGGDKLAKGASGEKERGEEGDGPHGDPFGLWSNSEVF